MTRKLNLYLFATFFFLILTSCSKDNGTESLIEDKLESMSGKEMLRELLIKNDNDVNQLARIFECSPSSLKRILNGETITTKTASDELKNILNQTLISKEKTLDELDPLKQSWAYKLLNFFNKYFLWFIIFLLILGFFVLLDLDETGYKYLYFLLVLLLIIAYLVACISIWYKGEPKIIDNFKNTFDPIWEQLK